MTKKNSWISLIIIFIFSSLGMCLWLVEIVEIKTWYSLSWLSGQLFSPFIAALFSVLAFMTPFLVSRKPLLKNAVVSIIILYSINISCFYLGKQLCYEMYSKFFWLYGTNTQIVLMPLAGLVLFIFLGLSYWLTAHKLLKKNKKINVFFITILLLLSIPMSLMAIQINSGFGSGTGWVDAVKMGYPLFWITMLLGLAGILVSRQVDFTFN